jgi:predicted DNA repair protein MutK
MAFSLLLLLDDITSVLDDVATMTKVAAKKTAGVLGDDLALNAKQVSGVHADRELPVVWAVARGSLVNKLILVPAALVISWAAPLVIPWLLVAGGAFLCYEGVEKILHHFLKQAHANQGSPTASPPTEATAEAAVHALERARVRGAIRTDFILSAEIVVITLGVVAERSLATQLGVLVAIGLAMTVGVYGLVAAIVKLDDLGTWLAAAESRLPQLGGRFILALAPWLMRVLSVAGTAAMFLVGGGIVSHELPAIHHLVETIHHRVGEHLGEGLATAAAGLAFEALVGVAVGTAALAAVGGAARIRSALSPSAA